MPDNQVKGTSGSDVLNGTAGRDLIYGYGGGDTMYGGDGNDMIYGGDGSDLMYGGAGDDGLVGGGDGDKMYGGLGNDTYYVNVAADQVFEFNAEGIDTVVSSLANYRIGANVERVYVAEGAATDSSGRANASGNELDNVVKGSSIGNSLQGGGGNDSVYGYGGNDIINGGTGNDVLDGGDGVDLVTFKDSTNINGVFVNFNLTNRYNTGAGLDAINNFENIEGSQFGDTLIGDGDVNEIQGLDGDDFIRGAGGDDDLNGGAGADDFYFDSAATNGVDRIRDFEHTVDELVFRIADGYDANTTLSYNTASGTGAQWIYNTTTQMLYYDADGTGAGAAILLANLADSPPVVLTPTDFALI